MALGEMCVEGVVVVERGVSRWWHWMKCVLGHGVVEKVVCDGGTR